MVERFNGRIADILRTHHFQSGKELEHTLLRYVDLYNNHLPQANLNCRTPYQVMYEWYENKPQFFDKVVHNRPEGDTKRISADCSGLCLGHGCRSHRFFDSIMDSAVATLQPCRVKVSIVEAIQQLTAAMDQVG